MSSGQLGDLGVMSLYQPSGELEQVFGEEIFKETSLPFRDQPFPENDFPSLDSLGNENLENTYLPEHFDGDNHGNDVASSTTASPPSSPSSVISVVTVPQEYRNVDENRIDNNSVMVSARHTREETAIAIVEVIWKMNQALKTFITLGPKRNMYNIGLQREQISLATELLKSSGLEFRPYQKTRITTEIESDILNRWIPGLSIGCNENETKHGQYEMSEARIAAAGNSISSLRVADSTIAGIGLGVFAKRLILQGEPLAQYAGVRTGIKSYEEEFPNDELGRYWFEIDHERNDKEDEEDYVGGVFINADNEDHSNLIRFINACRKENIAKGECVRPNIKFEVRQPLLQNGVAEQPASIFATRWAVASKDIRPGEELLADYGEEYFAEDKDKDEDEKENENENEGAEVGIRKKRKHKGNGTGKKGSRRNGSNKRISVRFKGRYPLRERSYAGFRVVVRSWSLDLRTLVEMPSFNNLKWYGGTKANKASIILRILLSANRPLTKYEIVCGNEHLFYPSKPIPANLKVRQLLLKRIVTTLNLNMKVPPVSNVIEERKRKEYKKNSPSALLKSGTDRNRISFGETRKIGRLSSDTYELSAAMREYLYRHWPPYTLHAMHALPRYALPNNNTKPGLALITTHGQQQVSFASYQPTSYDTIPANHLHSSPYPYPSRIPAL
jgi:hypothetical protein